MTSLSKKFEQIVKKELSATVLPVKTDQGILLGDVLIISNGTLKSIMKKDVIKYEDIYLNSAAISIAKLIMYRAYNLTADQIYRLDQEYGKWLTDSLMLKAQHDRAVKRGDCDRADVFWARYLESKERTLAAKARVDCLTR
jgi:hypothetical protein